MKKSISIIGAPYKLSIFDRLRLFTWRFDLPWWHRVAIARRLLWLVLFIMWIYLFKFGNLLIRLGLPSVLITSIEISKEQITKLLEKLYGQFKQQIGAIKAQTHADEWVAFNHSDPHISWRSVKERETFISLQTVLKCYGKCSYWWVLDELEENTSSVNFRVIPGVRTEPIFLRLHVGEISEARMRWVHGVRSHVLSDGVFEDSPLKHVLEPIKNLDGNPITKLDGIHLRDRSAEAYYAELFPYVHNALHYPGTSLTQIESFARRFGRLQSSIKKAPADKIFQGRKELYESLPENMLEKITSMSATCKSAIKVGERKPHHRLWLENRDLIDKWTKKCVSYLSERRDDQRFILLHDVHPHNTFFRGDVCDLIYDFEQVDEYSHGDAVAFSIHRFVREWVRSKDSRGYFSRDDDPRPAISRAVDVFIKGYSECGPGLPTDFAKELSLRIGVTAINKLWAAMWYAIDPDACPYKRSRSFYFSEVNKFLQCLKEASFFSPDADT